MFEIATFAGCNMAPYSAAFVRTRQPAWLLQGSGFIATLLYFTRSII